MKVVRFIPQANAYKSMNEERKCNYSVLKWRRMHWNCLENVFKNAILMCIEFLDVSLRNHFHKLRAMNYLSIKHTRLRKNWNKFSLSYTHMYAVSKKNSSEIIFNYFLFMFFHQARDGFFFSHLPLFHQMGVASYHKRTATNEEDDDRFRRQFVITSVRCWWC